MMDCIRDGLGSLSLALAFLMFTKATVLNLSNQRLNNISEITSLSSATKAQIIRLVISRNNLDILSGHLGMSHLQEFDASHNDIAYIDQEFFCHLPDLFLLDLSHNKLINVPVPCGANISKMFLGHNQIEIVSNESFLGYGSLEKLKLNHNALVDISGLAILNRSLTILSLARTNLTILGNTFDSFEQLQQLILHHNNIVELEICNTKSPIKVLSLASNSLTSVPRLYCLAQSLRRLVIESNQLTQVTDADFEGLMSLNYLDISNNSLEVLRLCDSNSSHNLNVSIKEICAHENQLNGKNVSVRCAATHTFTLWSNPLSDWPSVDGMESLQHLDMEHAGLHTAPPAATLHQLQRVHTLQLDTNELRWNDVSQLVANSTNLRILTLTHNLIDNVDTTFMLTTQVVQLNLSHNAIRCLHRV